ncbi:MAG: hypothetical protein ACOX6J_06240, partial [Oscillospiraceae bacterium]
MGIYSGKPVKGGLRERFDESYQYVRVNGRNGKEKIKTVYVAPWYFWDVTTESLRGAKIKEGIFFTVSLILYLIAFTAETPASPMKITSIASMVLLCLFVMELFPLLQFLAVKGRMTVLAYRDIS